MRRLTLLGAFHLQEADGTSIFTGGKPLAVLAYLACARNQRASRRVVADLLWDESTDQQQRGSLRQALFTLRHHLGQDALRSDGHWVELAAPIAVDVVEFEHAVEEARFGVAVAAYCGDFAPGFAAPGATEFERWVDTERLRLRSH